MQIYLKVKIKSLAAEAQMIRKEERKVKTSRAYRRKAKALLRNGTPETFNSDNQVTGFATLTNAERDMAAKMAQVPSQESLDIFEGLHTHRTQKLRYEARSAHLAYGFMRGFTYLEIEANAKNQPNWKRVCELVLRFGTKSKEQMDAFHEWRKTAIRHFEQR